MKNKQILLLLAAVSAIIIIFPIVLRYIREDLILLKISNVVVPTYLYMGSGLGHKSSDYAEHLKIMPHYICLKIVMKYWFYPLKCALKNLDKNVVFLDIDDKYANIRLSCDWCAICNGITETVKENIIKDQKLLEKIDIDAFVSINNGLDAILEGRTEKIGRTQCEEWCKQQFGQTTDKHIALSQIYLKLELIELRWCPFKRSKEFYYKNNDPRYLEPSEQVIHEVGRILTQHETITCNNCPRIVNANWKHAKGNVKSIFQPLLDYMMEEINK